MSIPAVQLQEPGSHTEMIAFRNAENFCGITKQTFEVLPFLLPNPIVLVYFQLVLESSFAFGAFYCKRYGGRLGMDLL